MIFSFNEAPVWFYRWVQNVHIDNLHKLAPMHTFNSTNWAEKKKICAEYFNRSGITSWYNTIDDQIWFNVDENSPKWTFEILRS